MPTKANGPLVEDYKRLIRAAKWAKAKGVGVRVGGMVLVIPLDDAYLDKLAEGQPPAPGEEGERKKVELDW